MASATTGGTEIDLTTSTDIEPLGGGLIVFSEFDSSTGTGVFESFVRIQASGTERGFNTDGALRFDEMQSSNFTRSLLLDAVPIVNTVPDNPGDFREFRLDINQTSSNPYLTLETAKIFLSDDPDLSAEFSTATKTFGSAGELVWDMDATGDTYVLLDYNRAPGSGNGDAVLYVPDADFLAAIAAAGCTDGSDCYVYLYSEFAGVYSGDSATVRTDATADSAGGAVVDPSSNDGFEEWSVRKAISAPTVEKSAAADFTRTTTWTIDKTVDEDEWNLFDGDDATSNFTVSAEKTVTDSDWTVTGTITFFNVGTNLAAIDDITDTISLNAVDVGVATVATLCSLDGGAATFNWTTTNVPAGSTIECSYSFEFASEPENATIYTNTVDVEFRSGKNNGELNNAVPATLTDFEEFQFLDPTTEVGADAIVVTDDLGTPGDTSDDEEFNFADTGSAPSYPVTFDCSDLEYEDGHAQYTVTNTASSPDVEEDASSTVSVDCYLLDVTKTADTSFTRTWDWTVEKSADQTDLLIDQGQTFTINYEIVVDASSTDSDHAVEGDITVTNPNPDRAAEVTNLIDVISVAINATVDCGAPPLEVPAGGTLECTYSSGLPDGTDRLNTATATIQNYSFNGDGSDPVATGTTDVSGTEDVTFSDTPTSEIDECITLDDTLGPFAGEEVCSGDAPKTFNYSIDVGTDAENDVVLECGDNTVDNTATITTNDTATEDEDSVSIPVEVTCELSCTLTQGYWRTHSIYGPAPYDETWALLGEDTPFFLSGQTYYEVLWTSPQGGNGYYILAHQYIAAQLNFLNGAAAPAEVQAAFDAATVLFNTYGPDSNLKGKNGAAVRQQFIDLAGILGSFNEGGFSEHCDEDSTSRLL